MKIFGHRFFDKAKDGGPRSTVTGYWLVEIKGLVSIALLRFDDGSRDSYHNHAFHSLNWVIKGCVREEVLDGPTTFYRPSWRPILTLRSMFHRVVSLGTTWVFSIRGPWSETWNEYDPNTGQTILLGRGRKILDVML